MAQGVQACQQGPSIGRTLGTAGNRIAKADALPLEAIEVWRMTLINIRRLSPLIRKDKYYIFRRFHC